MRCPTFIRADGVWNQTGWSAYFWSDIVQVAQTFSIFFRRFQLGQTFFNVTKDGVFYDNTSPNSVFQADFFNCLFTFMFDVHVVLMCVSCFRASDLVVSLVIFFVFRNKIIKPHTWCLVYRLDAWHMGNKITIVQKSSYEKPRRIWKKKSYTKRESLSPHLLTHLDVWVHFFGAPPQRIVNPGDLTSESLLLSLYASHIYYSRDQSLLEKLLPSHYFQVQKLSLWVNMKEDFRLQARRTVYNLGTWALSCYSSIPT